jgi:1-acyl-sn-glycerol-3-phosphate acyltransferase
MDTPVIFKSLPFQFRILAKESLWKWPFIGWHLNRSGQIPVNMEPSGNAIAGLNKALKTLRSGMPLFIFPEGGRTENGELQPFMNGPAFLAIRAQVPLIPLALVGTYELLPIHAAHFRPGPVRFVIGEPIETAGYTIRQADELTARLSAAIAALGRKYSLQQPPSTAPEQKGPEQRDSEQKDKINPEKIGEVNA